MSLDKNLIARMLFKEFCPSLFLKLDFTKILVGKIPFQPGHLKGKMSKLDPQWPVCLDTAADISLQEIPIQDNSQNHYKNSFRY